LVPLSNSRMRGFFVGAGACGIAAGTPLAVLAAIARVARSGAFVKDGAHLEALSQAGAIVFDKTGTLTAGAPVVSKVLPAPGTSPEDLLAVLAAAESYSEHPLGEAVVEHARSLGLPVAAPEAFEYEPGLGIRARVGGRAVAAGGVLNRARHPPAQHRAPLLPPGRHPAEHLINEHLHAHAVQRPHHGPRRAPPPNLKLEGVSAEPARIEIAGTEDVISKISSISTEEFSLANVRETEKRQVQLALPSGVTVTNPNVTVEIKVGAMK